MPSNELDRAFSILGDLLPDGAYALLTRRSVGDRRVSSARGDVEALTGHARSTFEAPTKRWLECIHPEDRERFLEQLQVVSGPEATRIEYRTVGPEGKVRWVRESLKWGGPSARQAPEIVGLLSDVTFERTVRARLSNLERDLWRSRKLESLGAMASGIAHDFNNLLTVILASSDLLRVEGGLPESANDDLELIRESANRGSELVRQILSFASRAPRKTSTVRPDELLTELEGIVRRVAGDRVQVSMAVAPDCWTVEADPAHLEQIVLNLTANARDAMPGGGRLTVEVGNRTVEERAPLAHGALEPGRYVHLAVRDEGRGMTPDVRARAFEPHFSTKEEALGAVRGGFGLATVLRIARGYDGEVDVESAPGDGSTFHVYLPARRAGAHARESGRSAAGTSGPVAESRVGARADAAADQVEISRAGGGRILVVEADPSTREELAAILRREGHGVASASSASAGLRIFDRARPPFDLIVTEVVLPDRSGHDLWRAGRKRVSDLGVVFVSAHDRGTAALEGVDAWARPVLSKPVDEERLLAAVREVLEARREDSNDVPGAEEAAR